MAIFDPVRDVFTATPVVTMMDDGSIGVVFMTEVVQNPGMAENFDPHYGARIMTNVISASH